MNVPKSHIELLFTSYLEPFESAPKVRRAGAVDLQCSRCAFQSSEAIVMAQHKFHVHGERNKFRAMVVGCLCPACGATFTSKRGAENHVASQRCDQSKTEAFVRKAHGMNIERIRAKEAELLNGAVLAPVSTLHRWFATDKQHSMPVKPAAPANNQAGRGKGKGKAGGMTKAQAKYPSTGGKHKGQGKGRSKGGTGQARTQQTAKARPKPMSQAGKGQRKATGKAREAGQQIIAHYFLSG
jgi:hypothetical protein